MNTPNANSGSSRSAGPSLPSSDNAAATAAAAAASAAANNNFTPVRQFMFAGDNQNYFTPPFVRRPRQIYIPPYRAIPNTFLPNTIIENNNTATTTGASSICNKIRVPWEQKGVIESAVQCLYSLKIWDIVTRIKFGLLAQLCTCYLFRACATLLPFVSLCCAC